MESIKPSAVSAPDVVRDENQLPAAAITNNASKTIDSVGPNVSKSSKKTPMEYPAAKMPDKSLAKRKVIRHEESSKVKSCEELLSFCVKTFRDMKFSYDLGGFTPKSMKDLEIMEHFREDVALFEEMVTNEREKVGRKSRDRTIARKKYEKYELLRDQLFLLKQEYFALCHKRFRPVSQIVLDLHYLSSLRYGDEPDVNQIARLAKKYGQTISSSEQLLSNALNGDRLSQHWQVFMSQSMEFLNVCADMAILNGQIPIKPDGLLGKDACMHKRYIDLISGINDTVGLSLIKTLDDAVNHYPHLKEKADLNRGLGSDVKGFSNWLNSASNKEKPFECYEVTQVIQMISASLCIGEYDTAKKLLSKFIELIDGKYAGKNADLDDIELLFYLASKALACLVCINLSDIDNNDLKSIEASKKLFKDVTQKVKQTFSLSEAECANLDECFQRFIEGPYRDVLLMHALKAEESARQLNLLISEEESEKTRKKQEIRGKLKRKMTRGYGYRKPVEPKAPVPAAQSTPRQDSQTPPRETPLPQGVQDAVKAFIADRPMAEVMAMIQSVVDDPESTPVVKAESYFALADMLDRKINKEFNRFISHTSFIYSYAQLIRAGVMPSYDLGVEFKKAIQDVTDITKICGWLDSVNDVLSTLSGLILRTDGLDKEFLDELASLHERVRAEVGLVSEIEATFAEIKLIWRDRFQFLKRNNKLPKGRRKPVQDRQGQSEMATFDLSTLQEVWGKLKSQVAPLRMTLEKTGEEMDRHLMSRPAACEQWEAGGDDDSSLAANDDSSLAANDASSLAANDDSSLAANDASSLAANDDSSLAANDDSSLAANDDSSLTTNDEPEVPSALVRQQVQRAQLAGSCYGPEYWSKFTPEDWLPGSELPDRHPLTLIAEALHRPLSVRAGGQQWLISEDGTATIKPGAIPKNSLNLTVDELADPLTPYNSRAL
ncbi:hypothetical protein J7439_15005 [Salinisphaera sp. G21_0]|nr:hypothetical protein [Salinisphaera sp. G21_0]